VTLIAITPMGERETYDLTIDRSHSFVANGIVVHNTIPKHTAWAKRIRECYPAPPGYLVAERDYSQGELKVIACIANETTMIQAYRNGMDLHSITGGSIGNYTYEEMMAMKDSDDPAKVEIYEYMRQNGKAGNFGKIYGMGIDGFIAYALNDFGVTLTRQQSIDFDQSFFGTYTRLKPYHAAQIAFVKQHGYVRSPLGRIRHLPLIKSNRQDLRAQAERQAINSPTQATLTDMMIWAFAESQTQLGQLYEDNLIIPFGAVHDAGYDYLLEDRAVELAKMQQEIMENLPFNKVGWNPQLKFTADVKLGPDMANLKKVK
jgi:DNA polymerase I-like protein with 3'-5' exonuclease and polymerase domains